MRACTLAILGSVLLSAVLTASPHAQAPATQKGAGQATVPASTQPRTVLKTTVRRVVLDVVVTDPKGAPARGLTKDDFAVTEDGVPQRILSFEANGFSPEMDYVPPPLPPQPAGTFINLPATSEKGPLYVLLYDLTNIDSADQMDSPEDHHVQMIARQQILRFADKPEGARFAIFVRSDGLHLVQGFTSDKALLYSALDPHHPKPHIPMVFLMGSNYGRGDRLSAVDTLHAIAVYLSGLPGRKNLIWFSSAFPLSLFATDMDGRNLQEETRATLDLLAHNQIAVYPVDARGVPAHDSHDQLTTSVHSDTVTSPTEAGSGAGGGSGAVGSSPGQSSSFIQGSSAVASSYDVMDGIARDTGGRAFYSNNDLASELLAATQSGLEYYTLTYTPTDRECNGELRQIHVELTKKGYRLSYRRAYYGTETPQWTSETEAKAASAGSSDAAQTEPARAEGDTLSANMEHGAPTAHQLVFVVQAHAEGAPGEGTPGQMAELATEPAYFRTRKRPAASRPLPPIPLQKDAFSFEIPVRQFKAEPSLDLEIAVAAYDADGRMMNAVVRDTAKDVGSGSAAGEPARFYRIDEELEVPVSAATIRFAVRDTRNDRTGAMEIRLPLVSAPAPQAAAH